MQPTICHVTCACPAHSSCPTLQWAVGQWALLVLCAWLRTVRLSRLSCSWWNYGLWSPQSLDCWVLLTAAVSHPHLTSKLQHTPGGTQKVPTQGAQMLLRTLLTYLYGIQFPFRGTHGHFSCTLHGCFNFVMIFLLGSLLLKQRTLSKAFIDFWRDAWREVLSTTKQVLHHRFTCNRNSFLEAACDSQEIIKNWGTIVSGCCRDVLWLSWLWLAGFRKGGKKTFLTHQRKMHVDLTVSLPHFQCIFNCGIEVTAKNT